MKLAQREPVAIRTAVVVAAAALVHLLVVFGMVPEDAEAPIVAVVDTAAGLILILVLRPAVTPNGKVVARVSRSRGEVVAGDAAALATGRELDATPTIVDGQRAPEVVVPVDPYVAEDLGISTVY